MKLFTALVTTACVMIGTQMAFAAEVPAVEQYTYGSHPDIAHVIHQDRIPDVCGVVQMKMTYEDHQGQVHTMQYAVMGNGCFDN